MSEPRTRDWEEWQLTAFALDELDADLAAQIADAAAEDVRLAAEIVAIRQTLDQVQACLELESSDGMGSQRLQQILAVAESVAESFAVNDINTVMGMSAADATVAQRTPSKIRQFPTVRRQRLAWLGALGLAASLMFALYFSFAPGTVSRWWVADREPSAANNAQQMQAVAASARAKADETRVPAQEPPELAAKVEQEWELQAQLSLPTPNENSAVNGASTSHMGGVGMGGEGYLAPPDPRGGYAGGGLGMNTGGMGMGAPSSRRGPVGGYGRGGYGGGGYGGGGYGGGGYGGGGYGGGGYGGGGAASGAGGYSGGYGGPGYGLSAQSQAASSPASFDGEDGKDAFYGGTRLSVVESKEARPFGLDLAQSPDGRETDELFAIAPPENAAVHPAPGRYKKYFDNQSLRRRNVPEAAGDKFAGIVDNDFQTVSAEPLSTFSIDVDSASYTKSRQLLLEAGRLPPADAVRIEEFINYFDYEYSGPQGDAPFGADLAVTTCPWQPEHQLVRIALQATKLELSERPKANIVFLLDVSGSMDEPNKLPLVKESIRMLVEQLGENDKIAMAVYAGAAGCVLEGTRGDKQDMILQAIENLQAGGSTNGGQGIQLAYDLARDNFVAGGINRVILCTDGDFNVGVTSTEALVELVEENAKSKIFLTVLGYGMGNTNDAMMEQISNRGNGVYAFVDSRREAHRQMVQQLAGNLMTVAKDVKIQVEFNPQQVQAYRLIGYENRIMAAEDFNNDKKDAGEIGAGHRVTALYEIVPPEAGDDAGRGRVEELRYQPRPEVVAPASPPVAAAHQNELLAVKLRYKQPEGDTSQLLTFPLAVPDADHDLAFAAADRDLQWAAVVAEFGMLLRGSQYRGNATWSSLVERAIEAAGVSPDASRQECLEMMRRAAALSGR